MKKLARIVLAVVFAFVMVALSASTAQANVSTDNTYLKFNNGASISVAKGEQPQAVLQFGARQSRQNDVGIICQVTGGLTISRFSRHNAFPSAIISPTSKNVSFPAVTFWSAAGFNAGQFTDLPKGQNYNVAFNLRTASSGQVQCLLLDGKVFVDAGGDLFANVIPPLTTPGMLLGAAILDVTVR